MPLNMLGSAGDDEAVMFSLQQQLDKAEGRPSGFDYLRISLSVSIIVWHTIEVCYGQPEVNKYWMGPLKPIPSFLIPSFFALSGFLIAGSLARNDLTSFLTLRVIRIAPALACEVLISAFLIGAGLTTMTLPDYFLHPTFWSYMLNMVGDIHYNLPGVFDTNPVRLVNAQLWTIPYELKCYISISVLGIISLTRKPRLFLLAVAALQVFMFVRTAFSFHNLTYNPGFARGAPTGELCLITFLAGVAIFLLRNRILFNKSVMVGMVMLSWGTLSFPETSYFSAFPIAYLTVWIGLQNPKRGLVVSGADYSYGMYLYGYPIQQAVYYLGARDWFTNLPLSLMLSCAAAYFSWTYVENPIGQRKKVFLSLVSNGKVKLLSIISLGVSNGRTK